MTRYRLITAGNDISRGLLMLGVGRPLGEKGLQWLKIHLVNLTGFVKGLVEEILEISKLTCV